MSGTFVWGADLRGADLCLVTFSRTVTSTDSVTGVTTEQRFVSDLNGIMWDAATCWPGGSPPARSTAP